MADEKQATGPSHIAYKVREGAEGKSYFNRIGAAFPHRDGQGLDVRLDSIPVNGRFTLRTPQERLAQSQEATPEQQQEDRER